MQSERVTLIADDAYSSMDNVEQIKQNNIEVITISLTGPALSDMHSDFIIDGVTQEKHCIPAQLEYFTSPVVNTYSIETTVAEKIDVILSLMEFSIK